MHTILLHMHDDAGQRARLVAGLALARQLPAHLLCVQTIDIPFVFEPVLMPPSIAHGSTVSRLGAAHAVADMEREALESDLTGAGLSVEWHRWDGDARAALGRFAPLSDFAIVSLPGHELPGPPPADVAGDLAIGLDVPVLAVPPSLDRFDLTAPVLVAWDGSHACGAAVRAAAPLLRRSRHAVILAANDADEYGPKADDAAAYLQRFGVRSSARRMDNVADVASTLIGEAEEMGASYLVMGMYGRSHVRERLLGGVTRSLIRNAATPLLLAH